MSKLIYSAGILSWLGEKVIDGVASFFYTVLLWLNCIIYSFISFVYEIFLVLANGGEIFEKSAVTGIVDRIYVIIGVIVLFLVAYSLLKNLVNPDEAFKGKKSPVKTISNVVISVVLIALTPTIFDFAFEFQNSLLTYNTIGKIIAGTSGGDSEINETIRMGGYNMAEGVWKAFIHVNSDGDENGTPYCTSISEEQNNHLANGEECTIIHIDDNTTYGELWENAKNSTTFYGMIGLVPRILDDKITYLFILDIIAGIFVLFVLLSYCLDMALRLVKLAVYELIAPLPILARIIPNDQTSKIFNNWIKATVSTFIEVFIRIAILYFAVIIIQTVGSSLDNLFMSGAYTATGTLPFVKTLAQALIIVGIVLFVKKAPEIIKEITGLDGGKYNVLKSAKQGLSLIAGGVAGGSPLAAYRAWDQAGQSKNLLDFSAIGNQYKRKMANKDAKEEQERAGLTTKRSRAAMNINNGIRKRYGFNDLKTEADINFENYRDIDGNTISVSNDTTSNIIARDENGRATGTVLFGAGQSGIIYNKATAQQLEEAKARNNIALSNISQRVGQLQDILDLNKKVSVKGKAEDIAEKEIDKGKFRLVDGNRNDLVLQYTKLDSNGNVVLDTNGQAVIESFGMGGRTKKEYEAWLEGNRERMSADDFADLSNQLKTSINVHSKEHFVDQNGVDSKFNNKLNDDIVQLKADLQTQLNATGIFDDNGQSISRFDVYKTGNSLDFKFSDIKSIKDETDAVARSVGNVKINIDNEKISIDSQNKAIERLEAQVKEQIAKEKASTTYKAYKATDEATKLKEQGKKGS